METFLHSFIVFDIIPPSAEGSDPIIYWYKSPIERSEYFKLNLTGLIITFANFCAKWGTKDPCDYISTENHEISILELSGSIWMAATINSDSSENRSLLISILQYCRLMFSHFFSPIPPLGTKNISKDQLKQIIENIPVAFEYIVNSIDWMLPDFTLLFDSYIYQPIQKKIRDLESVCEGILSARPELFDKILILSRKKKVVYSTFPVDVTRALALGMRKKFQYMYLHKPVSNGNPFSWLVGLYVDTNGIDSVYQQPIYYDNEAHLFVAFKVHKFKIVLTLKNSLFLNGEIFTLMPGRLKGLVSFLKDCFVRPPPFNPMPYTKISYKKPVHILQTHSDQIDAQSRFIIHKSIIRAHNTCLSFSSESSLAFPTVNSFWVLSQIEDTEENIVAIQKDLDHISQAIDMCNNVKNKNVNRDPSLCRIV